MILAYWTTCAACGGPEGIAGRGYCDRCCEIAWQVITEGKCGPPPLVMLDVVSLAFSARYPERDAAYVAAFWSRHAVLHHAARGSNRQGTGRHPDPGPFKMRVTREIRVCWSRGIRPSVGRVAPRMGLKPRRLQELMQEHCGMTWGQFLATVPRPVHGGRPPLRHS